MYTLSNKKKLNQKVGENIEHFRLLKKKTIKEMAFILKLSDSAYRNIERGISEITLSKIIKITNELSVSFHQLMERDESILMSNEKDSSLIAHFNKEIIDILKLSIQQQKEEIYFLRRQLEVLTKQK